jgi:acetyl-CoA carboxylase carboxyl transferase subunit alpha
LMLEYSTYSVISPEGCAAILWKSSKKADKAAEAMNITAERLLKLGLIDGIIPEPLGGAHRDGNTMAQTLKSFLKKTVSELIQVGIDELLKNRYQRLMSIGAFDEEKS